MNLILAKRWALQMIWTLSFVVNGKGSIISVGSYESQSYTIWTAPGQRQKLLFLHNTFQSVKGIFATGKSRLWFDENLLPWIAYLNRDDSTQFITPSLSTQEEYYENYWLASVRRETKNNNNQDRRTTLFTFHEIKEKLLHTSLFFQECDRFFFYEKAHVHIPIRPIK